MKRYLGLIVIAALVIVVIVFASNKWSTKVRESERDANIARIKIDYLERVGWIRANPDPKAYTDEVQTFLRWYFNQITAHQNRFGGSRDFDDYLVELDDRARRGKADKQETEKRELFAHAKALFDLLKGGSYAPVFTATDKGLRLDVVSAGLVDGGRKIRYQLALWGAPRELREEGKNRYRMVTSASFGATWRLLDEKGRLLGEVTATDASTKVEHPERLIAEFPPQMVFGHYDVELFPSAINKTPVKDVAIEFTVSARSQSGGDIRAAFPWKLELPAEWKLRPGEEWKDAQESIRPEEEIDPAAARRN